MGVALASTMVLSATSSFAAFPAPTVVVNDNAYSFDYFNSNVDAVVEVGAAITAESPVYVKTGTVENPTYIDVVGGTLASAEDMPAVTYYAADGTTAQYAENDGDVVAEGFTAAAASDLKVEDGNYYIEVTLNKALGAGVADLTEILNPYADGPDADGMPLHLTVNGEATVAGANINAFAWDTTTADAPVVKLYLSRATTLTAGDDLEVTFYDTVVDADGNALSPLAVSVADVTNVPTAEDLTVASVAAIADVNVDNGTAFADVTLPATVEVTLSDDTTATVPVTFAAGSYDGDTAGTYALTGTLDLSGVEGVVDTGVTASVNVIVAEAAGEIAVESVSAITTTGVDVTLETATEAVEGFTIEVKNPSGEVVAVDAINLEIGDSEVTFNFTTALSEVALGNWTVGGVTFDTAAQAAVQAVIDADTQVELWDALQSSYFTGAIVENITEYETAFTTAIAADEISVVADVQAVIDEVNAENVSAEEESAVVKTVADATNQVMLLSALQNDSFVRVNSDWIADYEVENVTLADSDTAGMLALAAANYFGETKGADIEGIQAAVDTANATKVDEAITAATAAGVLDLEKIATAEELTNLYIEDDAEGVTLKADRLETLAEKKAVVNVTVANTNAKLQNALNTLAGLTTALDIDTVNALELTRYRTAIAAAAAADKDIASEIQTIITTANAAAETDAVTAVAAITAETTTTELKTLLTTLADKSSFVADAFDAETIVDALLEDYRTAIVAAAAGDKDAASEIQTIVTTANDPAAALTVLVDGGGALDDADKLLAALKAKTLDLSVIDANKDAYFTDIAAIKTAAGTDVDAVQSVIASVDAVVDVNDATTADEVRTALTIFAAEQSITDYLNLSSEAKLEVAELVLEDRPAAGFADIAAVTASVGATSAAGQMKVHADILGAVNAEDADSTISEIDAALSTVGYDAYDDLDTVTRLSVAETFLNSLPVDEDGAAVALSYETIAAIKADIDTAIAAQ